MRKIYKYLVPIFLFILIGVSFIIKNHKRNINKEISYSYETNQYTRNKINIKTVLYKSTTSSGLSRGSGIEERKFIRKVELLDWWGSGRDVFDKGLVAIVEDIETGKSFKIERTGGTNHADCETLKKEDTNILKSIWGGFSWDRRPVIVTVNGRRLAASMSGMPHAGRDDAPAHEYINNRSGNYGRGENFDLIKNNGMDGHFDIHLLNSTRHLDEKKDPEHQANVIKAFRLTEIIKSR